MFNRGRFAGGAAWLACATAFAAMSASARGGDVCYPSHDSSQVIATEAAEVDADVMMQILGDDAGPCIASGSRIALPSTRSAEESYVLLSAEADAAPRPTLIPLPAPLWTGAAGLGAVALASAARRLRRWL